ncbi:MAG: motility associated factor glycosyltransferase family protein [Epsilonproteobacteria bacterium]|nr:motility associated factor glycosyltransferase family protein [Campylobacterota bacterium]
MNDVYKQNLAAVKAVDERLFQRLQHMIDYSTYEVYQGNDVANINYINKQLFKPVYDHPVEDTLKKVTEFDSYKNYPFLVFFGLGNGIFYKMLLANKKLTRLFVYEPDLEILYLTLHFIDFSQEIRDGRVRLVYTRDYDYPRAVSLLEDWEIRFFLKTYEMHILTPYYADVFAEEAMRVNQLNVEAIKHLVFTHGNDATDSLIGIKHSLHNMPQMVTHYKYADLKRMKNSDVAIIVSTGPSLTKQLPYLKEIADYATLISVDASLPILEKAGIKPDIVCVLERVEATSQFFVNTSDEFMRDIYFLCASLIHQKTVEAITGKKVFVMRPFPYNMYFQLDEFGYLGVGMSAANMAFELAAVMGYDNIIFIGQDLAYGDGVSHAKGHVLGEDEVKETPNDLYVPAYGGEGEVRTNKIWNTFRQIFEKALFDLKKKITVINATEGGARIHGMIEMPFKEAISKYISKDMPKAIIELSKIPQSDAKKYLEQALEKLQEGIEYGYTSKKRFEDVFLEVAQAWDDLVFLNRTKQLDKIDFKRLKDISAKIDDIKEIFNDEMFQQLFFDVLQAFLVNSELELATVIVQDDTDELKRKAKLIDWVMKHREWLFTIAGSMDAQLHVMQEEFEYMQEEYKKL